ncbi:unnamed protein product [Cyclocybe aegerita]|uniref:F-box domain-containing protein n=1 Tax=Cyclocybe aegerita TaxID=1973307 RepID=A0A8S0WKD2_CYCAE|nr:unnamed protein product [Cyclocybe aegerita]
MAWRREGWQEKIKDPDEERKILTARLIQATRERNEIIPIASIGVPEILSQIFAHLLHAEWPGRKFPPSVLRASQVCQLWRRVALSNASLWSYWDIDGCIHKSKWRSELAGRVGSRGLTVRANFCYLNCLHPLLDPMICGPNSLLTDVPLPRLQTISFVSKGRKGCVVLESLLPNLFPETITQLQRFSFERVMFDKISPKAIFSSLRSLAIRVQCDRQSAHKHFMQIKEALSRMPALEELKLLLLFPSTGVARENVNSSAAPDAPRVELPKLLLLRLAGHWDDTVREFLSWLVLPPTCSTIIHSLDVLSQDSLDPLWTYLAQNVRNALDNDENETTWGLILTPTICAVRYGVVAYPDGSISPISTSSRRAFFLALQTSGTGTGNSSTRKEEFSPKQLRDFVFTLHATAAPPYLSLALDVDLNQELVNGILSGAAAIKKLRLEGPVNIHSFVPYILRPTSSSSPTFLPHIELHGVDCTVEENLKALSEFFSHRETIGVPVKTLRLLHCWRWRYALFEDPSPALVDTLKGGSTKGLDKFPKV